MRAAASCRLGTHATQPARGRLAAQRNHVHSCAPKQIATGNTLGMSRNRAAEKSVYDRNFAKVARASTATVYQRERPPSREEKKEIEFNEAEAADQTTDSKGEQTQSMVALVACFY